MNKKSIKYIVLFICEMAVIYVGLGSPMPTDLKSVLGLIIALVAGGYTAWKNHNISEASQVSQQYLNIFKADGGLTAFEELLQEFDDVDEEE